MKTQAATTSGIAPSKGFLEKTGSALVCLCRKAWTARLAIRENDRDHVRLIGRLAVSHGSTVSVIEFQSDRFLVATTTKGQVSLLALAPCPAGETGVRSSRAGRVSRPVASL